MRRKHQRQVLINLLAIAVLALFLWVHEGCHLPTLEMELHRTERQRLMEKSRVIWTYEGRAYNDRDMLVGVTGNGVHAYSEVYGLDIWPRSVAEPTLVILPDRTRYIDSGSLLAPALLAVDPPAGAGSATLTIDLSPLFEGYEDYNGLGEVYTIHGELQESVFFFQLAMNYIHGVNGQYGNLDSLELSVFRYIVNYGSPEELESCPYTLEFFDGSGTLIAAYDNPAVGGASSTN